MLQAIYIIFKYNVVNFEIFNVLGLIVRYELRIPDYFQEFHLLKRGRVIIIIIRVFCPRAGLSLQTQEPRLQYCPKAGLPPQTQELRLQFYYG